MSRCECHKSGLKANKCILDLLSCSAFINAVMFYQCNLHICYLNTGIPSSKLFP